MAEKSPSGSERVSRRTFLATTGAAGVLAVAGCQGNPQSDGGNGGPTGGETTDGTTDGGGDALSGKIDISGSSTVYPLATRLKEKFNTEHPEVKISVSPTGSGGGFRNHFCVGETDFNNASRPIQESEKQLCRDNGVEWHQLKVATDAVTVVVNPEADWVDCVTVEELKQIWSPDTRPQQWSDVNSDWPDEDLKLYGAADTSGTFDYFTEEIVGESGKSRQDYSATEQDNTIIQGVAQDKHALGYLGFAYYSEAKDRVKALAIDNGDGCVEPSLETAKSGEYKPLARPLFTYPKKSSLAEDHVAEFARFFVEQSTNRELVAKDVGYVPNSEEEMQEELDDLEAAIEDARQ